MENKTIKGQTDNAFRKAVKNTPEISKGYRPGLQALKEGESQLIAVNNTRLLEGSVNIDACTLKNYPDEARWDYAIGYESKAYFIEIHPADTSNVNEVIKKAEWLKQWLKTKAPNLKALAPNHAYYWIPSGRCNILKNSPQYKRLAQSNVLLVSRFRIPVKD